VIRADRIPLLDAAPWLADGLEGEDLEEARHQLVVASATFQPGPWDWPGRDPEIGFPCAAGWHVACASTWRRPTASSSSGRGI
jgi:hypothetical protein